MPRITGIHQRTRFGEEEVAAFVPVPLPPRDPPLAMDDGMRDLLRRAEHNVARLELAGEMVPSIQWFIYAFVRKEAVVSSQIEGTQATLVDLLTFEAAMVGDPERELDVEEICNYVDALTFARRELSRDGGLPLSVRLLNETHKRLMHGARGSDKAPGEIRHSQNWIGGTRPGNAAFVPAPPERVAETLGALETYLHAKDSLPPLVRAGLAHVQFETIHPYLDGNGRLGRLLIMLLLEHWGVLKQPLLYLSLYFKRHRAEYYRRLSAVRTDGDWEGWMTFFLEGVATIANEAITTARDLFALVSKDRARVLGTASATIASARLFDELPRHPIVTMAGVVKLLEVTKPTAAKAVSVLESLGILEETTGRRRDRAFGYRTYVKRLREGTELGRMG